MVHDQTKSDSGAASVPTASHGIAAAALAARGAPYLEGLNAAQAEAVEALDGAVLVLAGAGTGKTRVLTTRLAHLLHQGRARPNEILAVTFTNKAAREMQQRTAELIGPVAEGLRWLGTFHSVAAKILRMHAELVGLRSNFTILDTDDQIRLLKQLIRAENIDEKRWPARFLLNLIDGWKNRALTPGRVPQGEADSFGDGAAAGLYSEYQARLKVLNACDFGDLLLHNLAIFQAHADILVKFRRYFRYICVDEYQDTNIAQYLWLRLLAADGKNICCVGDDDQSIYGWRGAEVGNILRFEKDFEGAKLIRLEQNYRSTGKILEAAAALISANKARLGKTLWTEDDAGEKLRLAGYWDGDEEARCIGEEIEQLQSGTASHEGIALDEMAILVRASWQMRAFEDRFLAIGLPYRVVGGPRFYERQEVRDALSYLRVVLQPDDTLAFERIFNTPRRGLGDKSLQAVNLIARRDNCSLFAAAKTAVAEKALTTRARSSLAALLGNFERWHALWLQDHAAEIDPQHPPATKPVTDLVEQILEESGYTDMWRNDKSPDAPGRLENLKELVRSIAGFESLTGFVEHIALVAENENSAAGAKISIMTLHAAKGLEFRCVFLPGWEEGVFPSQRSLDENGLKALEEERRLAYVGVTRARKRLMISFAANRRIYNQWQASAPSRFIEELPPEALILVTPMSPGAVGQSLNTEGISGASGMEMRASEASTYASPGWARLQARGGLAALGAGGSSPRSAKASYNAAGPGQPFATGERIFHQKFGYGQILAAEGDKLRIDFEKAGEKHVLARFVLKAEEAG